MTVGTIHTYDNFSGTGAQAAFDFDFMCFDTAHLEVYVDGVLQTPGTKWAAVLNADQAADPGGTVTFAAAYIPANATKVHVRRRVPVVQATTYPANGSFPAASHERALDLAAMSSQQRQDPDYFSPPTAVSVSIDTALTHGLGIKPLRVNVYLQCVTPELGYAATDETTPVAGLGVFRDSTNVRLLQAAVIQVAHRTTGAASTITPGSWRWLVEVWK